MELDHILNPEVQAPNEESRLHRPSRPGASGRDDYVWESIVKVISCFLGRGEWVGAQQSQELDGGDEAFIFD